MRARILFISLFAVIMIITSMLPMVLCSNADVDGVSQGKGDPEDPFMVHDAKELSMIGKGSENPDGYEDWTLSKSYKLANDIVFDPNDPEDNTNGGVPIRLDITYDADGFTVRIDAQYNISFIQACIGTNASASYDSDSATVTSPSDPGMYTMAIGGELSDGSETIAFAYALEIDIAADMNGWTTEPIQFDSNGNFDPLGVYEPEVNDRSKLFTGKLDGGGYRITGINVSVFSDSYAYAGIFASVHGVILNLSVDGSFVAISKTLVTYAGGIAGQTDSYIIDSSSTSKVTATGSTGTYAGGIVGDTGSYINNCYNTGNVTATSTSKRDTYMHAGGIAGHSKLQVYNCYNTGNVTATAGSSSSRAGGISGSADSNVHDCYNIGNVTAISGTPAFAGGIAGLSGSSVYKCYSTGNVTAVATTAYEGGIAGSMHGSSSYISESLFLENGDLKISGDGYVPKDHSGSRTEDDMKDKETYKGWDFKNLWEISNGGYPVLAFSSSGTTDPTEPGADDPDADADDRDPSDNKTTLIALAVIIAIFVSGLIYVFVIRK